MGIVSYPQIPFLQESLINNWQNVYPNRHTDFTVGRSLANVQNTYKDIWEGPTANYVFPASAIQMQVVSSSAADAAAGTGIQTVHIHYLDNLYAPQTISVTMNGVTPVLTVPTNILRINGFHALTVGTGGAAAGNISIQSVGGAVTYGFLSIGDTRARQAVYTIPAGHAGYVVHWQASSGSSAGTHFAQIELMATSHEGILLPGVFLYQDGIGSQNTSQEVTYEIPLSIPAQADVKVRAISDAANANVTVMTNITGWFE